MSRTISDGSVDLDKFPVSRVHQLAKKYKSSKATARHIKQVSGEPQATQINLLCHQRTELPQHRYKKKRSHAKPRQANSSGKLAEMTISRSTTLYNQRQPQTSQCQTGCHHLMSSHRCSKCSDTAHHEWIHMSSKKVSVQGMPQIWTFH